ncbi:hypothetical protein RFI_02600 [Reticulomyxa filosa]|uniref:Uncharacterized protein n=1 Tax=Reticulomyxa filosa TaxID=46433 RepID=X6P7K3_RETFI|nr:hypothetical protein RFI_02600 [Reticulomyxa filosa]|eukprot:ETO34495.1 hypothetical protein RFI_02600 [Reticulomyxa filosa]
MSSNQKSSSSSKSGIQLEQSYTPIVQLSTKDNRDSLTEYMDTPDNNTLQNFLKQKGIRILAGPTATTTSASTNTNANGNMNSSLNSNGIVANANVSTPKKKNNMDNDKNNNNNTNDDEITNISTLKMCNVNSYREGDELFVVTDSEDETERKKKELYDTAKYKMLKTINQMKKERSNKKQQQ